MKTEESQDLAKAFGPIHLMIGSSLERLDLFVAPAEGGCTASIRRYEPPYEKVVPDFFSPTIEDAVFRADYCLHEDDYDRAARIRLCRGELISKLRELARKK